MKSVFIAMFAIFAYIASPTIIYASEQKPIDCDKIRDDEKLCTACNLYFEARGEGLHGMYKVGKTTSFRAISNFSYFKKTKTLCEVVWARPFKGVAQFSWTKDGEPDIVTDMEAWELAKSLADVIVARTEKKMVPNDPKSFYLWYHADYVKPAWRKSLKFSEKEQRHLFYYMNEAFEMVSKRNDIWLVNNR